MKQIWVCENGEVEFDSQEDLEHYFKGESPELEKMKNGRYHAKFNPTGGLDEMCRKR